MSFAHVTAVATDANLPSGTRAVFIYDEQGREECYAGFTSTQDLIAWINRDGSKVDSACLSGKWEVDDAGSTYDFDGDELYRGETWDTFKSDHVAHMEELEADNRRWAEEIAREEGMLNGMASYNDWMGY